MKEHTIDQFVHDLATGSPTPGGGSVAALAAALAGALSCMVANLALSKEPNEQVVKCRNSLTRLYEACLHDIRRDADAYRQVVEARKLPKDTDEQKAARKAALQEGLKRAAQIPFETVGHSVDMLKLAVKIAPHARAGYISDLGVANFVALAALMSSAINVETNLHAIDDDEFVRDMQTRMAALEAAGHKHFEALEAAVKERMVGK